MKKQNVIAQKELIQRLVRYKNILLKFKAMGLSRIFSDNLGDAAGVMPSLVRKDFSLARLTVGHKRGGYPIETLLHCLDNLLGASMIQRIIIVGCGRIGTALLNYPGFSTENVQVVAGFDTNPARLDPHAPVPILPASQMAAFIKEQNIQVAVLAVPESAAAGVLDQLAAAGIQGVLNFSPVQLKAGSALFVQNINIALEIENLFYYVRFTRRKNLLAGSASG